MKKNQKFLKLKKVQIATLVSNAIRGGNSEKVNCIKTLQCSESIGTGETTSTLSINVQVCTLVDE